MIAIKKQSELADCFFWPLLQKKITLFSELMTYLNGLSCSD